MRDSLSSTQALTGENFDAYGDWRQTPPVANTSTELRRLSASSCFNNA